MSGSNFIMAEMTKKKYFLPMELRPPVTVLPAVSYAICTQEFFKRGKLFTSLS